MKIIYDDYLEHIKEVAESRILLDENVKKLGIPEIYLFDQTNWLNKNKTVFHVIFYFLIFC